MERLYGALGRASLLVGSIALLACSSSNGETSATSSTGSWAGGSGPGTGGSGAAGGQGGAGGQGAMGGGFEGPCIQAAGDGPADSHLWTDDGDQAELFVVGGDECARDYSLSSTANLRADAWNMAQAPNPRAFSETETDPVVRSGHDMFDALYALALHETREASVETINNYAFNGGNPVQCPAGGCFETGLKWTYVWTRDTAYAVDLGLAVIDPARATGSLSFKLSDRRGGGSPEIVQDTGTGGSWPISTDRVVWAIGAWEALKWLDGAERDAFRDAAYAAMANTADRDRVVVYDAADGLYRGEQSFLDWRAQSYPGWVTGDPAQIGMSKSLSTNVGHLRLLEVTAALATEKGLSAEATKYAGWASDLKTAIASRLYVAEDGMFSTYVTTGLDQAPARRYDLLGQALAVLADVGTPTQRQTAVESYPHLPKGAPVMWPQQQFTPIYHNRALWPFVTAYWGRAARHARNAAAVTRAVNSLMRGAAMHLSNLENFEAVTGAAWLDDGAYSGPIINSSRQLWSVAGYLSMVHELVFGLEASQDGIRFAPFLPQALREQLFPGVSRVALSRLPYRGKTVNVVLQLADAPAGGALEATSVTLDGQSIGDAFTGADELNDGSTFVVTLGAASGVSNAMTEVTTAEIADYRNLFGPQPPVVSGISESGGSLTLSLGVGGETPGDVTIDVYRDGQRIATALPGTTTSWTDPQSASTSADESHCYTIETAFASGTRSQRAKPFCWWGPGANRITSFDANAFTANGGNLVFNHGRTHYENWGDAGHSLTVSGVTVARSGTYYLQTVAGNGGPEDTGVTCAVKRIEVRDQNQTVVGGGYLTMPHLGSWSVWKESNLVPVSLATGQTYSIVVFEDADAFNMSELDHFSIYDGTGGQAGRFNRTNVAEIKLLGASLQ